MKLTETLKRRIDTFFRNLTDEEMEYLMEKYFNKHEKAINYNHCCTQLNGKKIIPFDDWIHLKKYTQLTPNLYKKGLTYKNHESLFKEYKKEQGI